MFLGFEILLCTVALLCTIFVFAIIFGLIADELTERRELKKHAAWQKTQKEIIERIKREELAKLTPVERALRGHYDN